MNDYKIWIEAEEWEPGTWDIYDNNSDVVVTFENGLRWVATFFTYKNLNSLNMKNKETGENLGGKYFWASDMILVDEISRFRITEIIEHLFQEQTFEAVFRKVDA